MSEALLTVKEARRAVEFAQARNRWSDDRVKLELGKALASLQNAEMFLTGDPG